MRFQHLRILAVLLLILASAPSGVHAATDEGALPRPARAFRVGASYLYAPLGSFPGTGYSGGGVGGAYEIIVKPGFVIGIPLGFKYYPGSNSVLETGYGLLLKHYFNPYIEAAREWWLQPYAEYGLLFRSFVQSRRASMATTHDTRLAMGTDFPITDAHSVYVDIAYHLSWLRYFDTPTLKVPYANLSVGWRRTW